MYSLTSADPWKPLGRALASQAGVRVAAPLAGFRLRDGGGLGELLGASGEGRGDGARGGDSAGPSDGGLPVWPARMRLGDALPAGAVDAPVPLGVAWLDLGAAGPAAGSDR